MKVLWISGEDYAATDFEANHIAAEVAAQLEVGGGSKIFEGKDFYFHAELLEFEDVDPKFVEFVHHTVQDYDTKKGSNFYVTVENTVAGLVKESLPVVEQPHPHFKGLSHVTTHLRNTADALEAHPKKNAGASFQSEWVRQLLPKYGPPPENKVRYEVVGDDSITISIRLPRKLGKVFPLEE